MHRQRSHFLLTFSIILWHSYQRIQKRRHHLRLLETQSSMSERNADRNKPSIEACNSSTSYGRKRWREDSWEASTEKVSNQEQSFSFIFLEYFFIETNFKVCKFFSSFFFCQGYTILIWLISSHNSYQLQR